MKNSVKNFTANGEIADEPTAHTLDMHLTAIDHYADSGKTNKAVKHMNSFKQLLDLQQGQGMISEKVAQILHHYADYLIGEWH